MQVKKKELSKECSQEIFTHNRTFFTPDEWDQYKIYFMWEFPEQDLPEKVKESFKIVKEIVEHYENNSK